MESAPQQLYSWIYSKTNGTLWVDLPRSKKTIEKGREFYNDTALCATPFIDKEWPEYATSSGFHFSRPVYCHDNVSVRLVNEIARVPSAEIDEIRIFCREILNITEQMVHWIDEEKPIVDERLKTGHLIHSTDHGAAFYSSIDSDDGVRFKSSHCLTFGYSGWSIDKRWRVLLGLGRKGCPPQKDWTIVTYSSWAF